MPLLTSFQNNFYALAVDNIALLNCAIGKAASDPSSLLPYPLSPLPQQCNKSCIRATPNHCYLSPETAFP